MDAKSGARERFDSIREDLVELSHRIHANPELAFEEEKASSWLCEYLDAAGFSVETGIGDLPTAFHARVGSGPLHIGICAEYDCLPGIGHACGHNIIAASAVGAAIAAAKVADTAESCSIQRLRRRRRTKKKNHSKREVAVRPTSINVPATAPEFEKNLPHVRCNQISWW